MAGKGFRVMCHIGSAPGNLADVLDLLVQATSHALLQRRRQQRRARRPAHRRCEAASSAASSSTSGHGGGSFDFTVCEPAMTQGAHVDTISSDIHAVSINTPGYPRCRG